MRGVSDDGVAWLEVHSQIGVPYQVSQVVNRGYGATDFFDAISNGFTSLSEAQGIASSVGAMAGPQAGALVGALSATSAVTSAIGNYLESKIPRATTIGSIGGVDALIGTPFVTYEFKTMVDDDNAQRGRPLCQKKQLSTIPGYLLIADPDIAISGTAEENVAVKAYMAAGFFYE